MGLKNVRDALPAQYRDGILTGFRGSVAHNTYVPPDDPDSIDDLDFFHVVVRKPAYYLGLGSYNHSLDGHQTKGEIDVVTYDIRKFVHLLEKGNPNVHSWLWCRPYHILDCTAAGSVLLRNRRVWMSQRLFTALMGYSISQLRRMTHYKFEGYMGEKRKRLVDKYGYDVKNAAHLYRLLSMGITLAKTGDLVVYQEGGTRDNILEIKQGKWSLDHVKEVTDSMFERFREAESASNLPEVVDQERSNQVLIQAMKEHWTEKRWWGSHIGY